MSAGRQQPGEQRAPRRKRVVLADRRGAREVPRTVMELEEQTSMGETLVANLMRVQLRSSLLLAGFTVAVLCGLPVLFFAVPEVASATVFGVALPWLILGVAPFPFLLLVGFVSTRWAERHEREFLDMVDRREAEGPA